MIYWCILLAIAILSSSAPARAATHDLRGEWSYSTSGLKVRGPCPKGKDSSGKLRITQSGDTFSLELLTGAACEPASMCKYSGKVAGPQFTGTSSAVVDDEGGKVTNTLTLTAGSSTASTGAQTSVYKHPSGMTCTWTKQISLSRPAPSRVSAGAASAIPAEDKKKGAGCCSLTLGRSSPSGVFFLLVALVVAAGRRRRTLGS